MNESPRDISKEIALKHLEIALKGRDEARGQRDELLASLKRVMEQVTEQGFVNQIEGAKAIAAIAKAEATTERKNNKT